MNLIRMHCKKCKEMMPACFRFTRSGWSRSRQVAADCSHCGTLIREMSTLDVYELGGTLDDIIKTKPAVPRDEKIDPVQQGIDSVPQEKFKPKPREKPQWLKDKIRKQYAERAKKRKENQLNLF